MVSDSTGSGLAYSATFNGEQDVYYLRIVPEPPILPQAFFLLRGILTSGGLSDLFASDDSALAVQMGPVPTAQEAPVQVVVEGTATTSVPLELGFLLEAHVSSSNISQQIELFNFVTGTWQAVDTRSATAGDSIAHVHVTTNPGRFIRSSDLRVMARVSYRALGPVPIFLWSAFLDRAVWTVQ
jgi:hypothetical protein